jgi:beta-galactosidase
MRYGKSNGWLDGKPAVITRTVGKGEITYIGAWMDDATMLKAARWMAETSGVTAALGAVPEGVDVYPREGDGEKVFILVNFNKAPQTVTLPSMMRNVLDDKDVRTVSLDHYGVAVLQAK